jgi:hypothetical protein
MDVGSRPILRRKSILGASLFLGEIYFLGKTYFWKEIPNFRVRAQQVVGKPHAKKEVKTTCRRKNNVAHMQTSLTIASGENPPMATPRFTM